jgi:hypothetical protein
VWDGSAWVAENDLETLRTEVKTTSTRTADLQTTADGLNSYVSSLTETIETLSDSQDAVEERVLSAESQISKLQQSVDSISISFEQQYIGGINYVQNSAGLNGITDDWKYTGTVSTDSSTDIQNNTVSDSAFVLGESSTLYQNIAGLVTGRSYVLTIRAKKSYSSYAAYFRVRYNGTKYQYAFSTTKAFDWTDYSIFLSDLSDPNIQILGYSRKEALYISDIMLTEGTQIRNWTPAPNEIYTSEVKIDRNGISVSNNASSQRTVITNTEFAGYYNDEVIFTLNKDETQTKKTTVDGELTVGKTKFVPMTTASEGLNIVILD